jgi:hypothetical protein
MRVPAALASRRDTVEVVHTLDRKGDVALALHERERAARILDGAQRDQTAVVYRRLRCHQRRLKLSRHLRSVMRNASLRIPSPPMGGDQGEDAIAPPG